MENNFHIKLRNKLALFMPIMEVMVFSLILSFIVDPSLLLKVSLFSFPSLLMLLLSMYVVSKNCNTVKKMAKLAITVYIMTFLTTLIAATIIVFIHDDANFMAVSLAGLNTVVSFCFLCVTLNMADSTAYSRASQDSVIAKGPDYNPASGLPMVNGMNSVDVSGNAWGQKNI